MSPIDTIRALISADQPVILWGAPGTGKTEALTALAREADAPVHVLYGSTLDPAEVGGVPVPSEGGLRWVAPAWAHAIAEQVRAGQTPWLFLDELSCAPPAVQAGLLGVIQARRAGPADLAGCRIVAAANPAESAADGGWLSPATASRLAHVPWSVDPTDWAAGEMSGWGRRRTPAHAAASALICGWIGRSPQHLAPAPPSGATELRGYPSPRAWSALARALAPDPALRTPLGAALARSLIGDAAAGELLAWVVAQDLPDPAALLRGAALPARGDQVRCALLALVAHLGAAPDRAAVEAAWRVIGRARPDATVVSARALLALAPDCLPPEALALGAALRGETP